VNPDVAIPLTAILSVFIGSPIAIAFARLIWRRASDPPRPPAIDADTSRRLMEMQQSLDTMAIEIERISEGQRFITKLMSERPAAAIAAPAVPATKSSVSKRGQ
jgi:hypothetical protein